ncbi:class IV adenylate cyclase [Haloplanus sp. GCM10025708]|uniref:class IV adenylate cyclase n=1 Tax=Haloferacaceae TaxID=1644056 RepID=UPI003621A887
MYEVELKVRAAHGPVRDRLVDRGAEHVGRVTQVDTYYDAPHRDFGETDEALRLRRETAHDEATTETRITYKGPLVEAASKTREEFETGVVDGETMDAILGELGFSPAAVVEKDRDRYALEGYTVTLDSVADLGEFVEVERAAEEASLESAREGAYDLLRSLELDPDAQIRTSYLGLLLDAQ